MRKFTLLLIDIVLLYGALFAMLALRYHGDFRQYLHVHVAPFSWMFLIWLLIFYISSLYEPRLLRNGLTFYSRLFEAIAVSTVISTTFFYIIPFFGIAPKTNLALFIVIFAVLEFAVRSAFNGLVETKFRKNVLLVGAGKQINDLSEFIRANPQLGYTLKSVVDPQNVEKLSEEVRSHQLDTIVISPEVYRTPQITEIFYKALGRKIDFFSLATFYERMTGQVPLDAIDQVWFLENLSEGSKTAYEFFKRAADIVFGFIFGVISLVFYPFIIVAMKLDSPGSIFYTQTRVGRLGKSFKLVKLRTMTPNAEAATGAVWTGENDPRVTRVGKFLRKTRLDEIPQFWLVLKGEMSLVGPRAERPEFHELLKKEIPFYEERYLIKPGISGWAQINYRYGASVADAAEKLKYDLYYIKNRSPLLDIGIVLKTLRTALSQSGK